MPLCRMSCAERIGTFATLTAYMYHGRTEHVSAAVRVWYVLLQWLFLSVAYLFGAVRVMASGGGEGTSHCIPQMANLFAAWCTDLHQKLPITTSASHRTCSSEELQVCEKNQDGYAMSTGKYQPTFRSRVTSRHGLSLHMICLVSPTVRTSNIVQCSSSNDDGFGVSTTQIN
jgi:hypothetical protein